MKGRVTVAWLAGLGLGVVASAHATLAFPTLDGSWSGTLQIGRGGATQPASAGLTQSGAGVQGTITLAGSGTVVVRGAVRRGRVHLTGTLGAQRIRWKAHWAGKGQAWRGPLVARGGKHPMHGMLDFARGQGGPLAECGTDFFASDVMPSVFEPICAQCHVAGGLAQNARLRVTAGEPAATALSALGLVDAGDPLHSPLLLKPRGELPHGGGRRIEPGSAQDQTLSHWVELVTTPGCGGAPPGGPGGGAGGGPTDPYTNTCAACHGADARGVQGYPDIHCSRSITDAVRNGRTGGALEMPAFPTMSDGDIATIQTFLAGLCPAGMASGSDLYAGNCLGCHGSDAGGSGSAPSVRCASRVSDALARGRGAAMPAFAGLVGADVTSLEGYLAQLCTQHGRTGMDLYAGSCAGCHGATAGGGRNGLDVHGPSIRCTGASDYTEIVRFGDDGMPAFPGLGSGDVSAIAGFVLGTYCPGG